MKEITLNIKDVSEIVVDANMCSNNNSEKTLENIKAEKELETMFGGWREGD